MANGTIERLLEVVRRSLKASRVELVDERQAQEAALRWDLPSGRTVAVYFDGPAPADAGERLQALLSSFGGVLVGSGPEAQPEAHDHGVSLVEELSTLASSVGALEALVIDAHSPVVWGSSHGISSEELLTPGLRLVGDDGEPPRSSLSLAARRVIRRVRAMPEAAELARGGHLRLSEVTDEGGLLARSFAGIYVLILLYEGRFDEIKTERGLHHALPMIERLVMDLPPPGPAEGGGAAAAKARR